MFRALFSHVDAAILQLVGRVTTQQAWKNGELLCLMNRFPHTIVDETVFLNLLKELDNNLRRRGKRIAIPQHLWRTMLALPLTHCLLDANAALMLIKVPVQALYNQYRVRKIQAYPFKWNDKVCKIPIKTALIATKEDQLLWMDENDEQCRKGLCHVGKHDSDDDTMYPCYKVLL